MHSHHSLKRASGIAALASALVLSSTPGWARHAERDGIGMLPLSTVATLAGKKHKPKTGAELAAAVNIDPRKSLFITDMQIMQSFLILPVLNALAAGSPNSMIARQVYDQWQDLANKAPGIGTGGHCDDEKTNGVPTLNGFQFDCARAEGALVGTNPTDGNPDSGMMAVAVVNRFDLASDPAKGGTDCGEYRLVFAKRSGLTNNLNRVFIIFEAVLPNPQPNGKDLSGCVPVAQFLANLSTLDPTTRAAQLKSFYFTGLPGFEPVVKASHYGFATPQAPGQIRMNLFMQQNWVLREYRLKIVNNFIKMIQQTDSVNPAGQLFDETDTHPKGAAFRSTDFLAQIPSLAINDINGFNMNGLPGTYNSGDADEQSSTKTNYPTNFAKSPNFSAAIQAKLTAIGSRLTPDQIIARAQANSCAGCHQLSSGKDLGGGLTWPASLGFAHVTEQKTEVSPEGLSRFVVSPAVSNVFLPHRVQVLQAFLSGAP
jgi:hypothetical protein